MGGDVIVQDWGATYDDRVRRRGQLEERHSQAQMTEGTRSRAVRRIVCCATCTLAVCTAMAAEESVTPSRSWVGSTFLIERDEFTDALDYKVIIESDRATLTDGQEGAFVMFICSNDAKWEPAARPATQARLRGFTGGIAVLDDVRRTRRSGFGAEYRGEGFDVMTRMRVDDHDVIGPGMWPTTRSANGLNTIVMPNSLAVRLVGQVVHRDARRLIADTGSGHVHRFDIAKAMPNLRDWMKRCEVLAERDTGLADQEAVDTGSEPYELVESQDELNGEKKLSLLLPDNEVTDAGDRATLLFTCRAHVERGYKVLVGVTPSVSGIAPRRERIDELAERLGESDSQVAYYRDALAAYAELFGTGEAAVVVPVWSFASTRSRRGWSLGGGRNTV